MFHAIFKCFMILFKLCATKERECERVRDKAPARTRTLYCAAEGEGEGEGEREREGEGEGEGEETHLFNFVEAILQLINALVCSLMSARVNSLSLSLSHSCHPRPARFRNTFSMHEYTNHAHVHTNTLARHCTATHIQTSSYIVTSSCKVSDHHT